MAVINLSAPLFYIDGISGVSAVVGYESLKNRVARYSFNAPSQGASGINLTFSGNSEGRGSQPTELYFYVGTNPSSHENAGFGYEYSGILSSNGNYVYTGTVNMVLYPNKTYYLWVFPTTKQYGWVFWGSNIGDATAESFGAAFSTIDRQEGTIGEEMSIRVNRYDTNYRHTVVYEFGGESGTLCEYSPEENIRWTPPIDLLYQTPNSDKKSGRIIVKTYDKYFVEIGSWESELSLSVPDWVVPVVSATISDKTNAKPTFGVFVQGVSVVDFIVESSGAYGSSIVKTQRYINGVEYNDLPVSLSGNITASVVVTDSRGRSSAYEETIFVQEYQFPQISISASRCDQDGTPNETGEYANVVMNLKSYQINGINEAFVDIQYGDNSVKVSVVVGERTVNEIVPAPSVSPIRISATLTDLLSSSEPATMVLSIGYATLDFLAGGKGIAFGTTATQDGFTCAMPAHFTGGVSIGSNALTDFVVEQGTSGIWFYRKWNSGLCELFGRQNVRKYTDYGMKWSADYPFALKTIYSATATNNYAEGGTLHGWIHSLNAKVEVTTTGCTVFAQNTLNVLSDGNAWSVSAAIVGTWK